MQGIESGGGVFISLVSYLGEPWFQISIRTPVTLVRWGGPHSIEANAGATAQSTLQPLVSTPLQNIIYSQPYDFILSEWKRRQINQECSKITKSPSGSLGRRSFLKTVLVPKRHDINTCRWRGCKAPRILNLIIQEPRVTHFSPRLFCPRRSHRLVLAMKSRVVN